MRKSQSSIEPLIAELQSIAQRVADAEAVKDPQEAKRARLALIQVTRRLENVAAKLDPILQPRYVFDPADPATAGRIVALTLVAQSRHPLSSIPAFYGSGVYAIYYRGAFPAYELISGLDHPIYVGKADPDDPSAATFVNQGTKLSIRLKEHAKSIQSAHKTLSLDDFDFRFLVVQTGFQKSAEDYLIHFFKPLWNSETNICFGLGKHGDSSTTRVNKRSPWDTMHPGRKWAINTMEDQRPEALIVDEIVKHFRENQPYRDIHEIFDTFIAEMRQLDLNILKKAGGELIELEVAEQLDPEAG